MASIRVKNFDIGEGEPLTLIAGPCVMESEEEVMNLAEQLSNLVRDRPIHFIFKSSYDKANRSSIHSYRGPGMREGLRILERVQRELGLPVLTDVHSPEEARIVGEVCDMIQIPAFLCRQTDIFLAAAETKAAVSIKKGQFLAPWDMGNLIEKLVCSGKKEILLIERGTCFGYNNLVVDFRSLPIMRQWGYPICFDGTHSVQLPGAQKTMSGGNREYIPFLTKAAMAVGIDALYLEVHHNPEKAKSDSATMLSLDTLPALLDELLSIRAALSKNASIDLACSFDR